MDTSRLIFWNVDTQYDFVEPEGKLYVAGAEMLKPTWQKLTNLAKSKNIRVINTADYHLENSAELSKKADYITTFPEHCMAGTKGAEYVKETKPEDAIVFDWKKEYDISSLLLNFNAYRNIVIQKDAFDVFAGKPESNVMSAVAQRAGGGQTGENVSAGSAAGDGNMKVVFHA